MGYNPVVGVARFRVDESATAADGVSIWPAYQSIFGDYPTFAAWRDAVWDKHRVRGGFRLARAYDGDALVGFAYGYTGRPGQWWTDHAGEVLEQAVAEAWLGGHFEVVSLGVVAQARRGGIGQRLMHLLTEGLNHDRLLLMTTADATDPARCLYASQGWRVIGPGIGHGKVIMGKRPIGTAAG
jgi:ribosomal protein S18 acetylase RimI-like enzyme